jgi:hypothetical protein
MLVVIQRIDNVLDGRVLSERDEAEERERSLNFLSFGDS